MFTGDYAYFVYDIVLDEKGIRVDLYETTLEVEENKKNRYYNHSLKSSSYPEDIKSYLTLLNTMGYIHMNQFHSHRPEILSANPLVNLKFALLRKDYQILEKVYDKHVCVNDMNAVAKYVHMIHIKTGEEFVLCVGVEKMKPNTVSTLEKFGFESVLNSQLINSINRLEQKSGSFMKI